ncbi:MAG: PAS domain-containing protein [Verrucomicrobia bacterium]|nr:PAS domain-containing protein [Verrucomicrobiota bacterium]
MKTNPNFSTRRLLAMTTIAIITIYVLLMFVLPFLWSTHRTWVETLAESVLVGIAATLILYVFWYRPLVRELTVRDEVERTLKSLQQQFADSARHRGRELADIKPRLESALLESIRLAATVERARTAIMIIDPQGRIVHVNPAFESATGFSRTELSGENPQHLRCSDQQAAFHAQLATVLERAQPWRGQLVNRKKDGTPYAAEVGVTPIRKGGTGVGTLIAIKHLNPQPDARPNAGP